MRQIEPGLAHDSWSDGIVWIFEHATEGLT